MNEVNRRTERVRVTMEWEVDAVIVDTESPGVHVSGWFADAVAIVELCDPKHPGVMRMERIEATQLGRSDG